jgi:hypothetical protein
MDKSTKTATAIGAGVAFLTAVLCIAACGSSTEAPSVPSGAVAVVENAPDGTISKADFDAALKQSAGSQGLPKPPSPSSPQYSGLRDTTMSALLLSRWVRGEADERGIVVSDTEITNQLKQFAKTFGGEKKFQQFLKQAGYGPTQARDQVELTLITNQIKKQVEAEANGQAAQKAAADQFQSEFVTKWRSQTTCAHGYVIDRCSNGPSPTTTSTGNAPPPPQGVPGSGS